MEKTSTLVNNIYSNGKEFISLKTREIKLEVYDKVSGAAAGAVNGAVLGVLGLCAFIFLNVGVAYWLSEVFESTKLGFLSLGGIYVLLIGIFFALRNSISKSIKNSIVVKMSDNAVSDYDTLIKEKNTISAQLERAETVVKGNMEELKDNIEILVQDVKRLKEDIQRFRNIFGHHDTDEKENEQMQHQQQNGHAASGKGAGMLPKVAFSALLELLINKFVLKDLVPVKKSILPTLAKALISSKVMNGNGSSQKGAGIIHIIRKLASFRKQQ